MKRREVRALRARLLDELQHLDRTAPPDAMCAHLCDIVSAWLGRRILLRFDDLGPRGLTGLWAVTNEGTYLVIVTTVASWTQRVHILLHELSHMLCDHQPPEAESDLAQELFYPDISPSMLQLLAGRSPSPHRDELEAEHLAGVLLRTVLDWAREPAAPESPAGRADAATRVWFSMGGPSSRQAE
ncbi:hypothetical protein [Allokutzneria sp. NRRL B-24872]|uniref:hypothetical protein n=1 Tax=Allokutzneria sp. NRRL B-24872 TaxID=1137961 RepID=UPI000A3842C2|nr:hypothetical protein [Allokutzneria sp. NRRL B-24872]